MEKMLNKVLNTDWGVLKGGNDNNILLEDIELPQKRKINKMSSDMAAELDN